MLCYNRALGHPEGNRVFGYSDPEAEVREACLGHPDDLLYHEEMLSCGLAERGPGLRPRVSSCSSLCVLGKCTSEQRGG